MITSYDTGQEDSNGEYNHSYYGMQCRIMRCFAHTLRPYLFDFMLLGQKWLANEVGRSV